MIIKAVGFFFLYQHKKYLPLHNICNSIYLNIISHTAMI